MYREIKGIAHELDGGNNARLIVKTKAGHLQTRPCGDMQVPDGSRPATMEEVKAAYIRGQAQNDGGVLDPAKAKEAEKAFAKLAQYEPKPEPAKAEPAKAAPAPEKK